MLWGNLEYAKRSDLSRGEVADLKATIAEQASQISALTAAAEGARAGALEEAAKAVEKAVVHGFGQRDLEIVAGCIALDIRRLAAPATGDANG